MSNTFPDWQEIQQWTGQPLAAKAALALGAGTEDTGALPVGSWASIILIVKATAQPVTVTVTTTVTGVTPTLATVQTFTVTAGTKIAQTLIMLGDTVEVVFVGGGAGCILDYAVVPSNVTTNAQVVADPAIEVQHNGALVGTERAIDIVDALTFPFTVTDDGPNTRIVVAPPSGVQRLIQTIGANVVANTVADSSLLGGGVTVPANTLGAAGVARLICGGSIQINVGPPQNLPRFRVNFNGAPVVIDTGVIGAGAGVASGGGFYSWQAVIDVNLVPATGTTHVNLYMIGTAQAGVGGNVGAAVATGAGAWRLVDGMWWVEASVSGLALNWSINEVIDFRVINAFASPAYGTYLDVAKLEVAGV